MHQRPSPRAAVLLGLLLTLALILPAQAAPFGSAAPTLASTPPLALQAPGNGSPAGEIVPGRLIVKFRPNASEGVIEAIASIHGMQRIKTLRASRALVMTAEEGRELEIAANVGALPWVEYAVPDYRVYSSLVPTDQLYGSNQWDLPLIGMPAAWDVTVGSTGIPVAVLDMGISMAHPDLDTQWAYAPGRSPAEHVFLTPPLSSGCSQTVPTTPEDDGWTVSGTTHGTHVSGTIAAESTIDGDGNAGIAGMAPGVRIMPLKVLDCKGSGSFSDVADAITFAADNGARVISMSLGAQISFGTCQTVLPQLQTAISSASGAVVVAAAGNCGAVGGPTPACPAGPDVPEAPAMCTGVMGVGATTSSDTLASFSTKNNTVDISAPGASIMSTFTSKVGGQPSYGYLALSGTSMATPHVAACAALMLSINSGSSPATVEQILKQTSVDLGTGGYDTSYGAGRLDCQGAVVAAASQPTPTAGTPTATLTRTPTNTPIPGVTASATFTPTPTPGCGSKVGSACTPTATPTQPAAGGTATPTFTGTATNTPIPGVTASATFTPSPTPGCGSKGGSPCTPTATPTQPAAGGTATPTFTGTATNTPVPSVPTNTPTNTVIPATTTPTATFTSLPATPTQTLTQTPAAACTPSTKGTSCPGGSSPTPTATGVPQAATATPTQTQTPAVPTETSVLPSATPTNTPLKKF